MESVNATSSRAGYRAKSSRLRWHLRWSSLCLSISSFGARSRRCGRSTSGREFFKSKMLQAQLPRGVSSMDIDLRFSSSCNTTATNNPGNSQADPCVNLLHDPQRLSKIRNLVILVGARFWHFISLKHLFRKTFLALFLLVQGVGVKARPQFVVPEGAKDISASDLHQKPEDSYLLLTRAQSSV